MNAFLDPFFLAVHSAFVLFILTGWALKKTRQLHLAASGSTMLSWFGLGVFFGWGYCPCTDWHWAVKRQLGETNLPHSYVKYYLDRLTGLSWHPSVVDAAVIALGAAAFALSCGFNLRDRRLHGRTAEKPHP